MNLEELLLPGYTVDPETGAWTTLPWPGDPNLPYGHPERLKLLPMSLGPQIILWAERWLVDPTTPGKTWKFTPGQKRFLHLWYAVDDRGRKVYRSGVKRGAKGTGKDPFLGSLAVIEFVGPVKFSHFTEITTPHGETRKVPIGVPHANSLVQIAANSKNQASKVLRMANSMMSRELCDTLGIDRGLTRTLVKGRGSRIDLLAKAEGSMEGDPATAVFLNESHHMNPGNGGTKVANVARRNVGKSPATLEARLLEATNAHSQGMESVAEESHEAWQNQVAGVAPLQDILYDSVEAEPGLDISDPDDIMRGLRQAYLDAPWADFERLLGEIMDTRTSVADTIRFYFNNLATAEDAWVEPRDFDALGHPDMIVEEKTKIALFLDCSKSGDATVLSGSRLSDGHVISLGCWRKPHGKRGEGWLAPREVVDAVVRECIETYKVQWFGVDPSPAEDEETGHLYWMPLIDQWHRDFQKKLPVWATPGAGGHSVLFDMRLSQSGGVKRNQLFTEAAMQTYQDIVEKKLTHDGNPILRQHVHNARRRPNQWGTSVGKINRSSDKLVDYCVSMIGARLGRQLALRSPKIKSLDAPRGRRLLNG